MRDIWIENNAKAKAPLVMTTITLYLADHEKHFGKAARVDTCSQPMGGAYMPEATIDFEKKVIGVTIIAPTGPNAIVNAFRNSDIMSRLIRDCKDRDLVLYYASLLTHCLDNLNAHGLIMFPVDVGARKYKDLVRAWEKCEDIANSGEDYYDSLQCPVDRGQVLKELDSRIGGYYAAKYAVYLPNISNFISENHLNFDGTVYRQLDDMTNSLRAKNIFDLNDKIKDL